MDLKNEPVIHPVFGEGIVVNQDHERITIQFDAETGIKHFMYPDAFEKYLTMSNATAAKKVETDLKSRKSSLKEQQKKEEAADRKRKELIAAVTQAKKCASRSKPLKTRAKK